MKLLDCTLRDGGYYNNWDFSLKIANDYLEALGNTDIDYIELGLRQFNKDSQYLGPFAFTPEVLINSLNLPSSKKYGVMVDAKTILNSELNIEAAIESLFVPKDQSKLSIVRIASHPHELEQCNLIITKFHDMGYEVGLNIMQISTLEDKKIFNYTKLISSWEFKPEVLYFADSLGNLDSTGVERIIKIIKKAWNGEIGFHAHNNQGKALENALRCIDLGVEWIDATVTGMGRGAGNLTLEDAYEHILNDSKSQSFRSIKNIAKEYFLSFKKEFNYGPNTFYDLAAKNSIHPTYIQTMLSDKSVHPETYEEVMKNFISLVEPNKFTDAAYRDSLVQQKLFRNSSAKNFDGFESEIFKRHEGRSFLIVGNGSTLNDVGKFLEDLVNAENLISLSVNIRSECYIKSDYLCALPNNNLVAETESYNEYQGKIITPKKIKNYEELFNSNSEIYNFGFKVGSSFLYETNGLQSKYSLSASYAIASAINMGAENIFLVGFDGYEINDPRYFQMVEIIKFFENEHKFEITSLTKSTYPLKQNSIFAYLI